MITIKAKMVLNNTTSSGSGVATSIQHSDDLEQPLVRRDEKGEFEDTKQLSNRQVLDKQKHMLKN